MFGKGNDFDQKFLVSFAFVLKNVHRFCVGSVSNIIASVIIEEWFDKVHFFLEY